MANNQNDPVARLRAAEQRRTPGVWKPIPTRSSLHYLGTGSDVVIAGEKANATYIATCTECVPALLERLAAAERLLKLRFALDDAWERVDTLRHSRSSIPLDEYEQVAEESYRLSDEYNAALDAWRERYGDE